MSAEERHLRVGQTMEQIFARIALEKAAGEAQKAKPVEALPIRNQHFLPGALVKLHEEMLARKAKEAWLAERESSRGDG